MKPVFSIITVTYNAAATIERTINSVLSQTAREHIEYIIIDGASTDNTLSFINNSQFSTLNSQLISEADSGIYDAMNKGLRMVTGDYVWFLNAGDTLHSSTTVEQVLNQITNYELRITTDQPVTRHPSLVTRHPSLITHHSSLITPDILYGETDIVDNKGTFIAHRRLKAPKRLNWKSFRMGMLVCHQSFIMRREMAPEYDLQYRYSADVDWCIRCMKVAKNIHNTHLILCNYLNEGVTTNNHKASLKERFTIMVKYYGYLPTLLRHGWFFIRNTYNRLINK